jgi:hypothetical protein
MRRLLALIIALSLPINSFATECSTPVKLLEEGSPTPCRGYLFSLDKELEVRLKVKDYNLLKQENEQLNQIIDRLNKKSFEYETILNLESQKKELWKTRAENITLKYTAQEEDRTKRDLAFVLAGIVLTVLAGWSIGQAAGR